MIDEKILDRLRKLLALAADPSNEHEAASAAAKAQELLFNYKLSVADVLKFEAERKQSFIRKDLNFSSRRAIPKWKRNLAFAVARSNFCKAFIMHNPVCIRFIGEDVDVEFCVYLFEYMIKSLERLSEFGWDRRKRELTLQRFKWGVRDGISWRNSFYFGAISILTVRLHEQRKQSLHESGEAGLVLVQKSAAALDAYKKIAVGRTVGVRYGANSLDRDGFNKGREAAAQMNLRRPLTEGVARQRLR